MGFRSSRYVNAIRGGGVSHVRAVLVEVGAQGPELV